MNKILRITAIKITRTAVNKKNNLTSSVSSTTASELAPLRLPVGVEQAAGVYPPATLPCEMALSRSLQLLILPTSLAVVIGDV